MAHHRRRDVIELLVEQVALYSLCAQAGANEVPVRRIRGVSHLCRRRRLARILERVVGVRKGSRDAKTNATAATALAKDECDGRGDSCNYEANYDEYAGNCTTLGEESERI